MRPKLLWPNRKTLYRVYYIYISTYFVENPADTSTGITVKPMVKMGGLFSTIIESIAPRQDKKSFKGILALS